MKTTRYRTESYEEEVPNTLEGFKDWEFSSGGTTGEDFNIFAKLFKKHIKKCLPLNVELVAFSKGHYYVSGFVERNGKFVYFSMSDVRHYPGGWHNNILIRTAKHEKDYTGGSNCSTTLESFVVKVFNLLEV